MESLARQSGISTINLLLGLIIGGFFVSIGFKLAPVYMDNSYVERGLKSLRDKDKSITQLTPAEIRKHMVTFYGINGVRSPEVNNIDVIREGNRTIVTINYEITVPLFSNISAVMTFQNYLDSNNPEDCCKPPKDYRPASDKSR